MTDLRSMAQPAPTAPVKNPVLSICMVISLTRANEKHLHFLERLPTWNQYSPSLYGKSGGNELT
jgi:hypothetical protein